LASNYGTLENETDQFIFAAGILFPISSQFEKARISILEKVLEKLFLEKKSG
jgi:hypothetical protein